MTLNSSAWKIPTVFASNRYSKRARLFGSKRFKWRIRLNKPTVMLFVKINLNFLNYTYLTDEQKQNFTVKMDLYVSPERKCVIDFQNEEKWKGNGGKINTFYTCNSLSPEAQQRDVKNPGDYLIMETEANVQLYYELIALIIGKVYGSQEEPICGEPEVTISHSSRFLQQYRDYTIECKNDKNFKAIVSESRIKCVGDMIWSGSYPKCLPQKHCPIDKLLTNPDSNQTIVDTLDELYFYNESNYYAIETSRALYGCLNARTDILVGNEHRICLKNGSWSRFEPYCYDPTKNRKFPIIIIVVILIVSLTIVGILITVLFSVYTKRIKNRINKQIAIQTKSDPENYDNTHLNLDEEDNYSYEAATDEEVVDYANHYYNVSEDYLRNPQNNKIDTENDYLRISKANSTDPYYSEEQDYLRNTQINSNDPKNDYLRITYNMDSSLFELKIGPKPQTNVDNKYLDICYK